MKRFTHLLCLTALFAVLILLLTPVVAFVRHWGGGGWGCCYGGYAAGWGMSVDSVVGVYDAR